MCIRDSSDTLRLKQRKMPGWPLAAMAKASRRFSQASERGSARGSWLPVNTTGTVSYTHLDVYKRQVKYIDIPLQHTNREVLRRMGRKGDDRWVRSVIEQIRREVPGVFIRTTLLAGFPGETEEQFEELCRFVDDMRFERLGCFAYSQEEGTPAARLDGQLEEEEKRALSLIHI